MSSLLPQGNGPLVERIAIDVLGELVDALGLLSGLLEAVKQAGAIEAAPLINAINAQFTPFVLPPAVVADMVERGIMSEGEGAAEAAQSGINAGRFAKMVQDTGEPPGINEMLRLYREGRLSEGLLDTMVAYSRIKTEWTEQVKLLATASMSAADAIDGTLKGVLSASEGADLFTKGGGMPDQFATLLDIAGNPIGVEQALTLLNHGLIDQGQVKQVILHSRVNPIFEPMAELLRYKFLAPMEIERILKAGGTTQAQASEWLSQDGLPSDQAAALAYAAAQGTAAKVHDATEAQVVSLYESRFITLAEAEAMLTHIGLPPAVQSYILELADAKKALTQVTKAVSAVQKGYLAGQVTDNEVKTDLGALGVPSTAVDAYLVDWAIEKRLQFKELTPAQVGGLYKKGVVTAEYALARWSSMGYSPIDAQLLLADYGGPVPSIPGVTK